jgi:hypothetical protein
MYWWALEWGSLLRDVRLECCGGLDDLFCWSWRGRLIARCVLIVLVHGQNYSKNTFLKRRSFRLHSIDSRCKLVGMPQPSSADTERMFEVFAEASLIYPRSLVGATAAVGHVATDAMTRETLSWDEIMQIQPEGRTLAQLALLTELLDEKYGVQAVDDLDQGLPAAFDLALASMASTVYELSQGESGKQHDVVDLSTRERDREGAGQYLEVEANLGMVKALFEAADQRITFMTTHRRRKVTLDVAYRLALLGEMPDRTVFPGAGQREPRSLRQELAGWLEVPVSRALTMLNSKYGLTVYQAEVAAHNILRS